MPLDDRAAQRHTWQYRAIEATRGNQTLLGSILIAVLDKSHMVTCKRFGREAEIDQGGTVWAPYQDANGKLHAQMQVCHVQDMIAGFRKLADKLKLKDSERVEMFQKLRQWVVRDARIVKEWTKDSVPVIDPKKLH